MKRKNDFSSKPYNRCLPCHHRTEKRCDGPRTSAMELSRWCEFMRDMKEANGLTNAYIAETTGISVKTIERLMAQNCDQDIMRETARKIEDAIIGSSNQYPCYLAFEEEHRSDDQLNDVLTQLEKSKAENLEYKTALDNIHASYAIEMQTIRDEAQRKIDFLLKQNDQFAQINEFLCKENDRKSKIIDKFLEKQLED